MAAHARKTPRGAIYDGAAVTVTNDAGVFRGGSAIDPSKSGSAPDSKDSVSDETERHLRCRTCGAKVADPRSVFSPSDGRVRHVFANPSGKVYEILTLRVADGVVLHGPPTLEFTWFPGHAWRIASCARCASHLGWSFESLTPNATPPSFFGLLTSELVEGP